MHATTSNAPPKSILKNPSQPPNTNGEERTVEQLRKARDLETALYHANIIQQRKNVELDILFNIETLMEFPATNTPSASDIALFKKLIRPFQPSDYDNLIEERNICKKCGYALCPNPNRTDKGKGGFRIYGNGRGKANEFKVVTKAEVEKWCSEECAKKALYIKIQLSETPAWERIGVQSDVQLREEPELPKSSLAEIAEALRKLDLGSTNAGDVKVGDVDAQDRKKAADLALERGDSGAPSIKGSVDVTISEKMVTRPQVPPRLEDMEGQLENLHLHLEGHISQFQGGRITQDDDEMDMN